MSTETVRLRNGQVVEVPAYASIDLMLDHVTTGRPIGELAGEMVLFWAEVVPDEKDGALVRGLVERCRAELGESGPGSR